MARARTTLDPFNAVAEPKRRRVLETLVGGERPVNDIVDSLGWPQPMISKHLAVLKEVGLVNVRREGRQRLYSVNGEQMKLIHDWAKTFERFWAKQLDRIKERAERKAKEIEQLKNLKKEEPK
jgi:DNA-binding transcriptional ArsR family regulator